MRIYKEAQELHEVRLTYGHVSDVLSEVCRPTSFSNHPEIGPLSNYFFLTHQEPLDGPLTLLFTSWPKAVTDAPAYTTEGSLFNQGAGLGYTVLLNVPCDVTFDPTWSLYTLPLSMVYGFQRDLGGKPLSFIERPDGFHMYYLGCKSGREFPILPLAPLAQTAKLATRLAVEFVADLNKTLGYLEPIEADPRTRFQILDDL